MKASSIIVPALIAGFAFGWAAVLLMIGWYWHAAATAMGGLSCLWAAHQSVEIWAKYWLAVYSKETTND